MAQQFQGKDFWSEIFDETPGTPFQKTNGQNPEPQNVTQQNPTPPQPATDLYQTPSEWVIVVDLPGIEKSDISLMCVRNILTIKGEAKLLFPNARIVHSERLSGQFERTINLPESIEGIKPAAAFRDGLLIVRIPRSEEKAFKIDIED